MSYLVILILAFVSGITTVIGVWLAICCKGNTKTIVTGIGFATGIMLLISFFELIPEAIQTISVTKALVTATIGIVVVGTLNFIIPHAHFIKEKENSQKNLYKSAFLVAIGLILHDFPEGFAMANSYILSPNLGILVAVTIALHNIPEEFALATPIVAIKDNKFLYKAAFISSLAEPAGAGLGLIGIAILPTLTPLFVSFAAGAMIFISLHELIPFAKKFNQPTFLILGAILSLIIFLILRLFFR